jgi:adenosylmethionine-8-amino-7-oxononanoate aminotransferase
MADLTSRDHDHLWHPFTQMDEWMSYQPLVIERAEGFFLVDTEGKQYLDGVSSIWCNVHGHGHPRIVQAMKEQIDRVTHTTMLGLTHVPAIELADRLIAIAPEGLSRVFFTDAGSTAVEVAIRMAFQYWRQVGKSERTRFVSLVDAYHGDTLGSVSLGFSEPFHIGYEPITFEALKFKPPFLCAPLNGIGDPSGEALEEAGRASLAELEALFESRGHEIAAVFIEPLVQGAAGIWPQSPSYVAGVRALCDRFEILLVCDEVATGFGRTGTMFAVEQAGITPDIMCVAKGLTAGYLPVAATLATEKIFEAFRGTYSDYKTLFHGHTYGGNPVGCAAAIANLDVFEEEDTLAQAKRNADAIDDALERHISPLPHVGPVRRQGLMVGFDILADPETGRHFPTDERRGHRAVLAAREEGVIIRPLADTMVLMPPLTMPPDLLERVVAATARAITAATAT